MNSEANSVNPDARREQEEVMYNRVVKRLIDVLTQQPEEKFGFKRLKALGATTEFSGTNRPEEVKKWLKTLEKCLCVMQCPGERKFELAIFLLQGEAEDWWNLEEGRRGRVTWEEFKEIFYNKYFSSTYIEE